MLGGCYGTTGPASERPDGAGRWGGSSPAITIRDVGRDRGGWREALGSVRAPALVVSIDSDLPYPPSEQLELAAALPNARLALLRSPYGHDAFLIEAEAVNDAVAAFRAELAAGRLQEPAVAAGRQQVA